MCFIYVLRMNNLKIYIASVFCMTEIIVIVAIETIGHMTLGWALFSKYILHISYFEDLILLILMVCLFLHITYRNLVEFSLL